jgi:hypothetical protein
MNAEPWWARSPIIVVPLSTIALGIVFVPFAVTTTDHAAEFYGAFVAALIAAAAAISGYFVQSAIANNHARLRTEQDEASKVRFCYMYLWHLLTQLQRARLGYSAIKYTQLGPAPLPTDQATLSAGPIRQMILPIEALAFDVLLSASSPLPHALGADILGNNLSIVSEQTTFRLLALDDATAPLRSTIVDVLQLIDIRINLLNGLIQKIIPELKKRSLI